MMVNSQLQRKEYLVMSNNNNFEAVYGNLTDRNVYHIQDGYGYAVGKGLVYLGFFREGKFVSVWDSRKGIGEIVETEVSPRDARKGKLPTTAYCKSVPFQCRNGLKPEILEAVAELDKVSNANSGSSSFAAAFGEDDDDKLIRKVQAKFKDATTDEIKAAIAKDRKKVESMVS
jgi:hypothetical protein